jgi:L-lactate dehydrogenase complex protein LldF
MSRLAEEFLVAAAQKSADVTHRATIKRNMDSYDAAVERGKTRFVDWEAARAYAAQVKAEGVRNLASLLESFESKIVARGGHVY